MILITTMLAATHPIVHVNASLNSLATVLLLVGLYLIKRGRVEAHKRTMLTAFAVSAAFLACYVWYHLSEGRQRSNSRTRAQFATFTTRSSLRTSCWRLPCRFWRSGRSISASARSAAARRRAIRPNN